MEIKFKRDTSFRKQFFVPDSFAHPAKMDAQLLIWIVENYTKKWETILDPMAGSGTTMLACGLSRNVILVELEEKFCKMMWDNWAKVRMWPQLGHRMGTCDIIQGDARQLEGLLVDKCIFSPPYAEGIGHTGKDDYPIFEEKRLHLRGSKAYGDPSDSNIGNLPYGSIDKIVTSPPYAEAMSGGGIARYGHYSDPELAQRAYSAENMDIKKQIKRVEEGKAKMQRPDVFTSEGNKAAKGFFGDKSQNPDNLGNLPYGNIDAVISSPPYEATLDGKGEGPLVTSKKNPHYKPMPSGYSVDAVVTSPPYEASITGGEQKSIEQQLEKNKAIKFSSGNFTTPGRLASHARLEAGYSGSQDNIGNLKSTSYLEAMLQVYAQCWSVLKDDGLMILVTKNFIRNKQIVRLDTDTIKLCEQAGFSFLERHYRKLPSQSFWRVIALLKCDHRKGSKQSPKCELGLECPIKEKEVLVFLLGLEPEARQEAVEVVEKLCPRFINSSPKIEFEDVLIFRKWS